jgi:hypothetical protein
LFIIAEIVEDKVVNTVMYPPVAVATYASTPRITRAGVYIIAGPIPPKAADREPINPTLKIVTRLLLLISKSPGTS